MPNYIKQILLVVCSLAWIAAYMWVLDNFEQYRKLVFFLGLIGWVSIGYFLYNYLNRNKK